AVRSAARMAELTHRWHVVPLPVHAPADHAVVVRRMKASAPTTPRVGPLALDAAKRVHLAPVDHARRPHLTTERGLLDFGLGAWIRRAGGIQAGTGADHPAARDTAGLRLAVDAPRAARLRA